MPFSVIKSKGVMRTALAETAALPFFERKRKGMKTAVIIGCGNIWNMHAAALHALPGVRLAAVCDIDPARLHVAEEKYAVPGYSDYRRMIEEIKPDTVHVCTPHDLHAQMCRFALTHGADVLCEKPLSLTTAAAEELRRLAEAHGRRLCVVYQNRFNPGTVLLRRTLEEGRLGKVLGGRCSVCWNRGQAYYDSGDWRGKYATEGGGVLINQAIHTLDLLRWLMGGEVESVQAVSSHFGETTIEVEDTMAGRIGFSGGAFGNFYFTTTYCTDARTELELICEKGVARLDAAQGRVILSDGEELSADETQSGAGKDYWGNSHGRQIAAFYSDGFDWRENLREGMATGDLVCRIYAACGRPPLPQDV